MIYLSLQGRSLGAFTLPAVASFLGCGSTAGDLQFRFNAGEAWQPIERLAIAARPPATAECQNATIVVLGMHRSGTSCLAGLLQASGVYFGGPSSFMAGAGPENPKGFWERREIRTICDTLLFSSGCDWDRVAAFAPAKLRPEVVEQQRESFVGLQKELATRPVAAFKEPRLCLLWPLVADLAADAFIVHVYRHPARVASSLASRNGFPLSYGLALWEFYNRAALHAAAGRRVHRVSYEEMMRSPDETAAGLRRTLREQAGIELAELPTDAMREVVDPDLCREKVTDAEGETWLTGGQRELLEALRALYGTPAEGHNRICEQTLRAFEPHFATATLPSQKPFPSPLGRERGDQSITLIDAAGLVEADIDRGEETVVIMPSVREDVAIGTARLLVKQAGLPTRVFVVMDRERQGFVKTFNDTAAKVSAAYVAYVAEDVYPGRDWLKIARDTLNASGKGLLAVNDGVWRGHVAAYGLVRSAWARRLYDGMILFPGYHGHGADVELSLVAKAEDQFVYEPNCVLVEIDPDKVLHADKIRAATHHPNDSKLLRERFDSAFGGLVSAERVEPLRAGFSQLSQG